MLIYSMIVQEVVSRFQGVFSGDEIEEYGDLPHVFFGDLFVPYIKRTLLSKNIDQINIIFSFLEDMANSNDNEVKNLLQVSVLESLMSDKQLFNYLEKHMGNSTFFIYKEIFKYLKIEK